MHRDAGRAPHRGREAPRTAKYNILCRVTDGDRRDPAPDQAADMLLTAGNRIQSGEGITP